nr:DUF4986 domain-containing protein [Aquibacillus sediminis]
MDDEALYVNLFISSQLDIEEKGLKVIQETSFPESDRTTLTFQEATGEPLTVKVRVPYWVDGEVLAKVNGELVDTTVKSGYLYLDRNWQSGDKMEVQLPMNLHTYVAKDDKKKQVIMYGPVVLAGALGTENFPQTDILADHQALNNHPLIDVTVLVANEHNLNEWVSKVDDSLTFKTDTVGQPGNESVTLIPFYALHYQRYTIYH